MLLLLLLPPLGPIIVSRAVSQDANSIIVTILSFLAHEHRDGTSEQWSTRGNDVFKNQPTRARGRARMQDLGAVVEIILWILFSAAFRRVQWRPRAVPTVSNYKRER